MHADDTAIDAWLGPAADDLDDDQRDRFTAVWDQVVEQYPAPEDQDLRNAALSAAVQYLSGETTPSEAGRALGRANAALAEARAAVRAVAGLAIDDGASEYALHQELGITRTTLRSWLGK